MVEMKKKTMIMVLLISLFIFIAGCVTYQNDNQSENVTENKMTDKLNEDVFQIISIEQEKDYSGKNIRYSPYLKVTIPENYFNKERNESSIRCTMYVDGKLVSEYYYERSDLIHIRLYNKLDTWGLPRQDSSEVKVCCENICKTEIVESV